MRNTHWLSAIFKMFMAIVLSSHETNGANLCPSSSLIQPCRCADSNDELQIWCSYSDLSKLIESMKTLSRHIPTEIDELILENNSLPSLPGQMFATIKVRRLMLRNNGLQQIALNWLSGLETTLQEVYIVEPDLRIFPDDSLFTLPKLEALTLSAGAITKMPAIFGLSRLKYIQLEAPFMREVLVDNFQGLPLMEQLHITSAAQLHQLESEFLHDLPKLSILNFTQSGLTSVHPRALTRLPMLTELFLTNNKFRDARVVGMAIRDMPNLSTVRLNGNLIDKLEEASFVDMPSVRNLDLSANRISVVYRAAFHRLPALRSLDLSDNQLKTIHPESFLPAGESNVEELRLANNEIEHSRIVRLLLDLLPRLRLLDLANNRLHDISFGTVQGHTHLEILHLEHNAIQRIDKEAFIGLPSLRELKLKNNSLSNYSRVPFWNLPALKGLDVSGNQLNYLDQTITSGLPSLRRFDASENALQTVDVATFLITPNLEHVNMSHNSIDVLASSTFAHLQKLFDLDLSYNNLSQIISELPKSTEYLYLSHNEIQMIPTSASDSLQLPLLKLLDLSGNKIHHILPDSFSPLCTLRTLFLNSNLLQKLDQSMLAGLSQLRLLNLANNKLIIVNKDSFKQMKHLTDLNLSGNRLEIIDAELLSQNTELKRLDVSKNKLLEPLQANFSVNRKIEELNMSYNFLTEFPMVITAITSLHTLDLSHNRIKSLPYSMLPLMPSLKELRLDYNKLQTVSEGVFEKSLTLSVLNLEHNEIERMTSNAVKSLPSLTALNLSKNKLTTIPSSAFTNLPALQVIELQENQLTHIANDAFTASSGLLMLNLSHNLLHDINKSGFRKIRNLEALDISYNRIARFPSDVMNDMNYLVILKADNNRLCDIEGSPFEGMSRLRVLSLRDNKMTTLPETTFRRLRSSFMYLDIEGNPMRCSCDMLWLHTWLQKDDINLPGPRCSDGILLRDHKISRMNCEDTITEVVPGCEYKSSNDTPAVTVSTANNTRLSITVVTSARPATVGTNFTISTAGKKAGVVGTPFILPLPEETDYFDPKYVEYNETHNSPNGNNEHDQKTIPPEILTHYIPGDTPTIYAGARSRVNATSKDQAIPGVSQPRTNQSSTGFNNNNNNNNPNNGNESGFTFFGVPISSLNLNNFWNSAKSKNDRSRIEEISHSTGKYLIPTRVPELSVTPELIKNGFVPMLPGIGGFTPITTASDNEETAVNNRPEEQEFQNPYTNRSWYIPGATIGNHRNSIPGHAAISKIAISLPRNETVADTRRELLSFNNERDIIATSSRDLLFESSTPIGASVNRRHQMSDDSRDNRFTSSSAATDKISRIGVTASFKNNKTDIDSDRMKNKSSNTSTEDIYGTSKLRPATIDNNSDRLRDFNPSPLSSGLSIPNGELQSFPSPVRTNQAKIQLVSGPSPHAEEIQSSSHLRLAKSSYQFINTTTSDTDTIIITAATTEMVTSNFIPSTAVTKNTKYSDNNNSNNNNNSPVNWYFENYNQSNIEPFIGGTPAQVSTSNQSNHLLPSSTLNMLLSVLYFVYKSCCYINL